MPCQNQGNPNSTFVAGQDMGVSKNRGTPKSSILIGCSLIFTIHFGGPPLYVKIHLGNEVLTHHISPGAAVSFFVCLFFSGPNMDVSKNSGFPPKSSHLFIGFSIIFTFHFGGFSPPYFLEISNIRTQTKKTQKLSLFRFVRKW